LNGKREWEDHIKTRKHKNRVRKLKEAAEEPKREKKTKDVNSEVDGLGMLFS